jgi:hypothetical protein
MWRGDYQDARKLEGLCRNTLFINLSITMILTIQQTLLLSLTSLPSLGGRG